VATSPFNVFFDPCLVQWATIVAASFFFYLYMSSYMDSNFTEDRYLIQMIINFVQFGQATQLGYCNSDHGFNSGGFHTSFGVFSLDMDAAQLERLNRGIELYFGFQTDEAQGGETTEQDDDAGSVSTDTTTGLLAIIGIYGALQAYQAYEGYMAFVVEFDEGDYFEAGAFLGKSIVDVAALAYLILLALQISQNQK